MWIYFAVQKYLLKVQQYNPADLGEKAVTVAALELDMAQYAAASTGSQALDLRLPIKANPAWSSLHGDVVLKAALESRVAKVYSFPMT